MLNLSTSLSYSRLRRQLSALALRFKAQFAVALACYLVTIPEKQLIYTVRKPGLAFEPASVGATGEGFIRPTAKYGSIDKLVHGYTKGLAVGHCAGHMASLTGMGLRHK